MRLIKSKSEAKREEKRNPELFRIISDFPFTRPVNDGWRNNKLVLVSEEKKDSEADPNDEFEIYGRQYIKNEIASFLGCAGDKMYCDFGDNGVLKYERIGNYIELDICHLETGIVRFLVPVNEIETFIAIMREMITTLDTSTALMPFPVTGRITAKYKDYEAKNIDFAITKLNEFISKAESFLEAGAEK